jgi:bacterioferritin (cytochrome b1)
MTVSSNLEEKFIPDLPAPGSRANLPERFAIESHREMINFIGAKDPTSRRLIESILAQEEEHAEDLVDLLEDLPRD